MSREPIAFTVIICTYETELYRTLLSVDSVLAQDFDSYELIITDDGSENTYFEEIHAYFKRMKFTRYQLLEHDGNTGTVENYYRGLSNAGGRYVKGLGAGDMLYSRHTLSDMYRFLEEKGCKLAFGNAQTYAVSKGSFLLGDRVKTPRYMGIYNRRWLQCLAVFAGRDWVPGIQMFGELSIIKCYIRRLRGISKYTEDIFQLLIYNDKLEFVYCNQIIAWYEQGSGISTSGNLMYNKYLRRDVERVYCMAYESMRTSGSICQIFYRGLSSKAFMFTVDSFLSRYCGKPEETGLRSNKDGQERDGFLHQKKFQDEVKKTWERLGLNSSGHWKRTEH